MAQSLTTRSIQGALLDARTDRLINDILTEGMLTYGDEFLVREQSSPNMTVRVGSGSAGDRYVVDAGKAQGVFIVRNPDPYIGSGNMDVSIANGDPSFDRIDGIDLQVYDDETDSSGETKAEVVVTQGTPSSSPSAPAVPAGAARLATVLVAANESTSIGSGDITDMREVTNVWAAPRGAVGYAAGSGAGISNLGTTLTNVPGCSVTVTTLAGRRYKISGHLRGTSDRQDAYVSTYLRRGGSNLRLKAERPGGAASGLSPDRIFDVDFAVRDTPGAGSSTYTLDVQKSGTALGTVNISDNAGTTFPFVLVEDIGGFAPKDA